MVLNKSFIETTLTKLKVFKTGSMVWIRILSFDKKIKKPNTNHGADKIKNQDIRSQLGLQPVLNIIERNELKRFRHVSRLEEEKVKKVMGSKNNTQTTKGNME